MNEAGKGQAIYVITHPDDDTQYLGDFCTVVHNDVTPNIVIGLNSSALIQYGLAGYRVLCHSNSRLLNGASFSVLGKTSSSELDLVDEIPQIYWKQFIEYTATQSVQKLDSLVS
jgi:hypothetical protein